MKVSEKSLELNVGAEILGFLRNQLGMPKAYLRGLTQGEERQEGADFFVQLDPATKIFAFQFKRPKGQSEHAPYSYTLKRDQHIELFRLAGDWPGSTFYVFPFYVTPQKLRQDVPNLAQDTWLLDLSGMPTEQVFSGQKTKTIYCEAGRAQVNPEYKLFRLGDMRRIEGIPVQAFARWYNSFRSLQDEAMDRRDSWLARGLRVVIVTP